MALPPLAHMDAGQSPPTLPEVCPNGMTPGHMPTQPSWGIDTAVQRQWRSSVLALTLLSALPGAATADEIHATFDGGILDADNFTIEEPEGFSVLLADDEAQFTKDSGTGNGFGRISGVFSIKGDFDISVVATRGVAGPGTAIGLVTSHVGGFNDVFFDSTGSIVSYFAITGLSMDAIAVPDASPSATFRIRRVGEKLFHEYDVGQGFIEIDTLEGPQLAGPVKVGLFLGEQSGSTDFRSASFDDFFIQGDEFTPPCGNGILENDEVCDDDDPAWLQGESCNASCERLACGDPDDTEVVTAVDALYILRTSVGTRTCDLCVCDVDLSGGTAASDALRALRKGVGQTVELTCPACT
jgi:hypothetical protein